MVVNSDTFEETHAGGDLGFSQILNNLDESDQKYYTFSHVGIEELFSRWPLRECVGHLLLS